MQQRGDEVAVRRRVQAVGGHAREPQPPRQLLDVDRIAGAGGRPGAERQRVGLVHDGRDAGMVAPQRRRVREEEMRREHRLGAPQVRVRRHQRSTGRRRAAGERVDQPGHLALHRRQPPPQVQPQVERHLLVAGAAGMQPPAHVARALDQLALDECVHVLVVALEERGVAPPGLQDGGQSVADGGGVRRGQHAGPRQRLGPRQAALHVVLEQAAVEGERRLEAEDGGVRRGLEPAGPQVLFVGHRIARSGSGIGG